MPYSSTGITVKEMARQLGLSVRAVSQALRADQQGTTRVAPKTAERVLLLAEQQGYRLNSRARALRTRRFRQAGILVRYDFENMRPPVFETPVVFGLCDYLNTQGWHLVIIQDHGSGAKEGVPHYVREHSLDGLILCSQGNEADEQRAAELLECGIPHIWCHHLGPENAVGIRDDLGAELAAQHLVDLGHRRVVFVGTSTGHRSLIERRQGYRRVMEASGLKPTFWTLDELPAASPQKGRDARSQSIVNGLIRGHRPTAVVCYSDIEALKVMTALHTVGIAVPEGVSVVGYNDMPFVDLAYPALTTVRSDGYALGRAAGEIAAGAFADSAAAPEVPRACSSTSRPQFDGPATAATSKKGRGGPFPEGRPLRRTADVTTLSRRRRASRRAGGRTPGARAGCQAVQGARVFPIPERRRTHSPRRRATGATRRREALPPRAGCSRTPFPDTSFKRLSLKCMCRTSGPIFPHVSAGASPALRQV